MPHASRVIAFTVASLMLIAIPGPSVLFTIGRAISAGRTAALLTVVGNALGLYTQLVGVALGLGPIIKASATAYLVLKLAGAGYLIWLGIAAIRDRRSIAQALADGAAGAGPSRHALRDGYVVGVTNPKTVVFFAALLPQFVAAERGQVWLQMMLLGLIFVVLAVLGDGAMALLAGRARDWFSGSPQRMERIGAVGGAMMMALGVGALFSGRPQ